MRILLFGCQVIAINVLEFLLKSDHEVVGVITHDEERDRLFYDQSVSEYCDSKKILNIRFDGRVDYKAIAELKPDIIFSVYYRKILPLKVIELPALGCVNIHPGLLPLDRGPNPTLYNVLRGDQYAGATLHYIDEGMDTGDVIDQEKILTNGRTGFELNRDIMQLGYDLLVKNFTAIINQTNQRYEQDNDKATCNTPFRDNFRYINWNLSAENILNHIRAFAYPYKGSLTHSNKTGECVINGGYILNEDRVSSGPGYYEVCGNNIKVQTHTKPILIDRFHCNNIGHSGRFISGVPE